MTSVERLAREIAFVSEETRQRFMVLEEYRDMTPDAAWSHLTEFQHEQWIGRTKAILARASSEHRSAA